MVGNRWLQPKSGGGQHERLHRSIARPVRSGTARRDETTSIIDRRRRQTLLLLLLLPECDVSQFSHNDSDELM